MPADTARAIAAQVWGAVGGDPAALARLSFTGEGALSSCFAATDLAAGSIGAAALAVSELMAAQGAPAPAVATDRRLASLWFGFSVRPVGWSPARGWDPIAGDYPTKDGWIRLHTNAPHHRAAALRALGVPEEREAVAAAVAGWNKAELEAAVVAQGGCAAEMRSLVEWAEHPAGRAVAQEPLVHVELGAVGTPRPVAGAPGRPLAGLRVLDLTRVLAGPVATRFLAGYGAEVLRIDPPDWDEPVVLPEVTLGKRCAGLDLKTAAGRRRLEELLADADVFVHGYRADALERLGLGDARRRELAPSLVDVRLNAYGWTGPWRERRGFDSLVQMSAGVADAGMRWKQADRPTPLPVQALDYATGFLMATAAVRGLTERITAGRASSWRVSLARTAAFLTAQAAGVEDALAPQADDDLAAEVEQTGWGPARRLVPPAVVEGAPMRWAVPAGELRSSPAQWA